MSNAVRQRVSDVLIRVGTERALSRRQLRQSLDTVHPETRGYAEAMRVAETAKVVESALLWLGWRLQPRAVLPELLDLS